MSETRRGGTEILAVCENCLKQQWWPIAQRQPRYCEECRTAMTRASKPVTVREPTPRVGRPPKASAPPASPPSITKKRVPNLHVLGTDIGQLVQWRVLSVWGSPTAITAKLVEVSLTVEQLSYDQEPEEFRSAMRHYRELGTIDRIIRIQRVLDAMRWLKAIGSGAMNWEEKEEQFRKRHPWLYEFRESGMLAFFVVLTILVILYAVFVQVIGWLVLR